MSHSIQGVWCSTQSYWDLRVILEPADTIGTHHSWCWPGYYQLRQLRPLVQSMTVEAARTAAAVLISYQLDYCNLLLYGLPDSLLRKLQSVQNANSLQQTVCILITGTWCSDHTKKLVKSHCHTDARLRFFSLCVIKCYSLAQEKSMHHQ